MKARAYYSDPEHNRSFVGRWIWIYRGKGFLELTKNRLRFTRHAFELELIPKQVQSVNVGTFARTAKPIRLRFLDLGFVTPSGDAKHVYIVPLVDHKSVWLTSVWKLNANVNKWLKALTNWLAEPNAPPNGGPAALRGDSGVTEGPPSVS